ncbi:MAG TPA: arsenate reductase ArsC [Candidatus Acidoferrum sp.]
MPKRRVLILCTGNSARSQMAEGIFRHLAGDGFAVESAGTNPVGVNPLAVEAMREIGIDIGQQSSKSVSRFEGQSFDLVITVCDNAAEHCPVFPGAPERLHWSLPDPAAVPGDHAQKMAAFRAVRDQLLDRTRSFLK